jgi:hypothetical protein
MRGTADPTALSAKQAIGSRKSLENKGWNGIRAYSSKGERVYIRQPPIRFDLPTTCSFLPFHGPVIPRSLNVLLRLSSRRSLRPSAAIALFGGGEMTSRVLSGRCARCRLFVGASQVASRKGHAAALWQAGHKAC